MKSDLVKMKYGKEAVSFTTEGLRLLDTVMAEEIPPLEDPALALAEALQNPIGSPPLSQVFSAEDEVLVLISDITRGWINYPSFLPHLLNELNALGIPDHRIHLLTATGTHRAQTEAEKKSLVGDEVYGRFPITDHDSLHHEMVSLGTTSSGNTIYVNALVKGKKVLLTGGIAPHLMSGFGGGRKSVVPGIASYDTVQRNHLLTLDPAAPQSSNLIGLGVMEGNPLHQDMVEACALLSPAFLVNVAVNDHMQLAGFFAGHWYQAWETGALWIRDRYFVPVSEKADVVIASCGGFPKDINLYQSCKTLFNAAKGVRDGGALIFLAECSDGAGADTFFNWSQPLKEGRLDAALREDFTIPGYIFYAAIEAARKVDVYLVSRMDPAEIATMGFIPCPDVETALTAVKEKHQESGNLAPPSAILLPYGGSTVPLCLG